MNYLQFNHEILISDGTKVHRVSQGSDLKDVLVLIEKTKVCVIDAEVLIAAAPEYPIDKKDKLIVRKFNELYQHEAYVIQDERIDVNLFQLIGIKEQKLREIYSLIPTDKVELIIPYAVSLRNALVNKNIDLNKTVVFVDDLGNERLLTVFDGLKFSRTRVIVNNGEDILPEIKRSQIDFFKKTEEFLSKKSSDFIIITNDQSLATEICKNTEELKVEYLNISYPALEGLKVITSSINFRLPEENLRKRKEVELKKKVTTTVLSLCLVVFGSFYLLFNNIELKLVVDQHDLAKQTNERLDVELRILDQEIYRQDLKTREYLNYGITYLAALELIPTSYAVNSFKFFKTGKWNMEMTLFSDEEGMLDPIPRIKILKSAEIKDIFINNQPGKHLRITL